MRIIRVALLFSVLALPALAVAQTAEGQATAPAKPAAAASAAPAATGAIKEGTIDFGVLASDVVGDDARYNRFRDLSNGPLIDNFRMRAEKNGWYMNFAADHVAREDGRYGSTFVLPGTFKGTFQFDEIRELVSNSTRSLFTQVTPGVLRVDDNVQNALQTALGPPSTLSTVLPATLNNFALPVELGTRRHIASGRIEYIINPSTNFNVDVAHTHREGSILYSGTFGFSNAVDIPQPINQNTSEATLTIEHRIHQNVLLKAGFNGSYFRNDVSLITWDNPYRLTDVATLSSQGRTQVAPSNNWSVFNVSFQDKLPAHSVFTAYTAFGFLDDNGQMMIPQTINTAIVAPALSQAAVGGKGETRNVNLSFVSRPSSIISFDARYRYYDYVNQTPIYSNGNVCPCAVGVTPAQRVAYDSSLQTSTAAAPLAAWSTDRFGGSKQVASVDMRIATPGSGSFDVGYAHNAASYDDRLYSTSGENIVHVSFDALSTQYFSLHTKYEHSTRRGVVNQEVFNEFVAGGEQPTLLHYDIADRNRDLFTAAASIFPVNGLSITFTAGDGRDSYPASNFGLVSAKHTVYGVGADYTANDHVSFNLSFNQDNFDSMQWSRTANPAPDPTFTNPARDWSDTAKDDTKNVIAGVRMTNLCHDKVDVQFGYDYTRGRGSYVYGTSSAPFDPVVPTTITPLPVQLPQLSNDFTRTTMDLTYKFTAKFALGFTYWYENFKVSDLALGSTAVPGLNLGTTDILMGYQYLPYTANSYFARATYKW